MLTIVQTVALLIAALVSAYAVLVSERDRRNDVRRARVERLLEAAQNLAMEATYNVEGRTGRGPDYAAARVRLQAELQLVGVEGFKSTDLLVRETPSIGPAEVLRQSETAIREIGHRLNELATPRPLVRWPSRLTR